MSADGLVDVHLYGALAEQFGTPHRFAVSTPQEAARALSANYPNFRSAFLKAAPRYRIMADGEWRDGGEAALLPVSRELHFVPLVEGHAPVFAALLVPYLGTIGAQIVGGLIFAALMMGINYLLNPKKNDDETADKSESYTFSGSENTAQQGAAVPIIYGRCFVGSVVVSAGMTVADQVDQFGRPLASTAGPGGDSNIVHELPSPIGYPTNGLPMPRDGWPEIAVQLVGDPEPHLRRLGPVGWDYYGQVTLLLDTQVRDVDVFVSKDRNLRWDYWQGFLPYDEKVFLP